MMADRRLQLGMRLALLACLAGALWGPVLRVPANRPVVIALEDVSASRGSADRTASRQALAELGRAAGAAGAELRVVPFAAHPDLALAPNRGLGGQELEATNLELALDAARALVPPGRPGRILLASDGRETVGSARAAAARARDRRLPIFYLEAAAERTEAPESSAPEVALLELEAPPALAVGQSFHLSARLWASQATTVQLELLRGGVPNPSEPERELRLEPGETWLEWPTRLEDDRPAFYRLRLVAAPDEGEGTSQETVAGVAAQRRPRVRIVESVPRGAQSLAAALQAAGMSVERVRHLDPAGLEGLDLLVLADPGRFSVGANPARRVAGYVREAGGGLLVTAGPQGFGSGGYSGALGELLPLAGIPAEQESTATLALALVIDRSGSMSGPKLELTKEAARAAALRLHPDDHLAVIAFDNLPRTIVRMQPAFNRQRILADISRIHAGGGTNVAPALREALDQLLAVPARRKHLIVLSDGQSPAEGIDRLVAEAAGGRITVSAVAVGDGADLALLEAMARRGGGRFHQTRDPDGIPRIFTEETAALTNRARVEHKVHAVARAPAQMTAGIDFDRAPPLFGYARTRVKPGAEVLLATSEGDPLLGRWQRGLGKVAVFTSDLGPHWAASWLGWSGFPKLFPQIARGLMRQAPDDTLAITARFDSDHAVIAVEALSLPGRVPPVGDHSGSLSVLPFGANAPTAVPLTLRGGRAKARVAIGQVPAIFVTATFPPTPGDAKGEARVARAGFSRGPPPERRPTPTRADGQRLLAEVSRESGGAAVAMGAYSPLLASAPGGARPFRPQPLFILAALAFFLAEIAVSRANFRAPAKERRRPGAGRKTPK